MTKTFPIVDPSRLRSAKDEIEEHWRIVAKAAEKADGQWIDVGIVSGSSYVTRIRRGIMAAFRPAGHFDATSTAVPDGRGVRLYVRHLGPDPDRPVVHHQDQRDAIMAAAPRRPLGVLPEPEYTDPPLDEETRREFASPESMERWKAAQAPKKTKKKSAKKGKEPPR